MVSHVQKRSQTARFNDGNDLVPLLGRDVIAGRVVAAGVQNHDGARCGGVQCCQHAFKVDAAFDGIVIRVALNLKTRLYKERAVVFPAGVRNQHGRIGLELLQKVSANFQATGATNALGCRDTSALDRLTFSPKYQSLDGRVVSGNAFNGQITTRLWRIHHQLFSGLHALQQG